MKHPRKGLRLMALPVVAEGAMGFKLVPDTTPFGDRHGYGPFTQGPWGPSSLELGDDLADQFKVGSVHCAVVTADGRILAITGDWEDEQSRLDAKLMASAPLLLDMIRVAVRHMEGNAPDFLPGGEPRTDTTVAAGLRRALRDAIGVEVP